jgi:branched-chain amino acid transport system permease protein
MNITRRQVIFGAVALGVAAVLPALSGSYPFMMTLACYALIAAVVAISLDLLMGNTALLSFGHAAWYGLGSYIGGLFAKLVSTDLLLGMLCCLLVAAVVSYVIGQVLVRQVGKTFAILTLAFGQILFSLTYVFSNVTGGEDGLQSIPQPTLLTLRIASTQAWYWLLLGLLAATVVALMALRRAPIGQTWLAVKQNEQRASFIGVDIHRMKLAAYVASAALASVAGGLYALFAGATSPDAMSWFESGRILMYVILGGVGTIIGPAIGAVVFTFAEYYVNSKSEAWLIYFGGLFVVMVIVAPGGIYGYLRSLRRRGGAHA